MHNGMCMSVVVVCDGSVAFSSSGVPNNQLQAWRDRVALVSGSPFKVFFFFCKERMAGENLSMHDLDYNAKHLNCLLWQIHELANHYCIIFFFLWTWPIMPRTTTELPLWLYSVYDFSLPTPFELVLLGCSWKDSPVTRLSSDRCLPHYIVTHAVRLPYSWNSKPCKLYSACRLAWVARYCSIAWPLVM